MTLSLGGAPRRLLGRSLGPAALLLLLFATPDAAAFCRTTTAPLPPSFNPRNGCFEEGLPLFWKNACVSYSLQADASIRVSYDTAVQIVDSAFRTWTAAQCSSGSVGISASNLGPVTCNEVRYNPSGGNQNAIIFRDKTWPYEGDANTLGLTTITFNAETGEIFDADLEINSTTASLSITDEVPKNGFDLLSVVTHEVGHFFGLAHATSSSSTMYANYRAGTTALRSLTPDDIEGICAIYPSADTRTVAESVSPNGVVAADACDPEPRHGFVRNCDESAPPKKSGCAAAPGGADASLVLPVFGLALTLVIRRRKSM